MNFPLNKSQNDPLEEQPGQEQSPQEFDIRQFLRSWVLPLFAEVAALLLVFNFILNITYVPSGSMIPTIAEHSVLLSVREYDTEHLQRGEIYSFRSDELDKTLILRLIGLPGETVRIEGNGNVYIDDQLLDEPYVVNQEYGYTGTFTIPEGCYFFLGDNRSGSSDARYWDDPYTPADQVVSRAVFTFFPFGNFGLLK